MSTFTVLLLCIQACLVQNVFSQCLRSYDAEVAGYNYGAGLAAPSISYSYGAAPTASASASSFAYGAGLSAPSAIAPAAYNYEGYPANYGSYQPCSSPYGGAGEGNVAVAGELPIAGNTAVAGQVPITGAIGFGGAIPAAGAVSISGNCACGCGGPYQYQYQY